MTFGPSSHTEFMGMKIDNWSKWSLVASFSFLNTAINEYISASIYPFFLNVIQDHKASYVPYPHTHCMMICLAHDVYTHVMSIFGIYLLFSQLDFLLIRALADVLVTFMSTRWFLQNKIYDVTGYEEEKKGLNITSKQEMEMEPLKSKQTDA